MKKRTFVGALLFVLLPFIIANANGPQPSVGLYWFANVDPTAGGGVCAPLNQLLIRTDVAGLYYKSGNACTSWTAIAGSGAGNVSGTGTNGDLAAWNGAASIGNFPGAASATCAANNFVTKTTIAATGAVTNTCAAAPAGFTSTATSPNLMVASGTTSAADYPGSTAAACAAGQAVTRPALSTAGVLSSTCSAFTTGSGTPNALTIWTNAGGGTVIGDFAGTGACTDPNTADGQAIVALNATGAKTCSTTMAHLSAGTATGQIPLVLSSTTMGNSDIANVLGVSVGFNGDHLTTVADPTSATAQDVITGHYLSSNSLSAFTTTLRGTVPATGGSTGRFLKDDGTWATVGGTTPSVTVSAVAQPVATIDLSVLGTTDWVVCSTGTNSTAVQHNLRWQSGCTKRGGVFLASTLDTIKMLNYDTAVAQNATMNGPAADAWGAACSTLNVCETWGNNTPFSTTTATGFGWSVPATTSQQVMRVYGGGNNDDITLTCKLTISGTTASTTSTINSGATHSHFTYTVTFTGGVAGDYLACQYLQSAIYGTSNSVNLGGISLGPT